MSIENARKFREQVAVSLDLQDKIRAEPNIDLVKLGAESGYIFSPQDLQVVMTEVTQGELNDFELEMVSGGTITTTKTPNKPS